MSIGMIFLMAVSVLILLGISQRVLDRLRLNDKTALAFVLAIIIGGFIPNIRVTNILGFNIGGFLIPLILAVYLFAKADTRWERTRSILAALIAGVAIYLAGALMPEEPESMIVEPMYVYAVLGGLVAYLFGRSRRAAFIAGILGMILSDVIQVVINYMNNIPSPIILGGGGAFGATMISGILAVLIAEIVGETREKLQGGTAKKSMKFEHSEFVGGLGVDNKNKKHRDRKIISIKDKVYRQKSGGDNDNEEK